MACATLAVQWAWSRLCVGVPVWLAVAVGTRWGCAAVTTGGGAGRSGCFSILNAGPCMPRIWMFAVAILWSCGDLVPVAGRRDIKIQQGL
eukprot:9455311-Prorocentrum_lima.AAC.1